MKKNSIYLISFLVLIFLGFAVWKYANVTSINDLKQVEQKNHPHEVEEHHHHEETLITMTSQQIRDLGIQTKVAAPGELSVLISARGKIILQPDHLIHILPKISGVVKEAFKNLGDLVEQGEILALLESHEMADIKANYLATEQKLRLVSSLLEREKRLNEKKISAEQDYLNAKSIYEEALINTQLAKQKLQAFGVSEQEISALANAKNPDLSLYEIRSPMKGEVIERHITKGEIIENTTAIYEIADLSIIRVEIGIYPKDLVNVHKGQLVDILFPDGKTASAKIIYLSPLIQDETITAKAIVELENSSENWRPGSFVKVNIAAEKVTFPIVIPKEAYQEMDGKEFVFVKVPEGFEKRHIQLGMQSSNESEVLNGLKQGEEYASSNTFLLKADLGKEEAEHEH